MTIKPQWDHDHYQVSSPFVVNVNIDGPQSTTHNESSYNSFPANSTKLRSVLCQQCNLAYSCETYQACIMLSIPPPGGGGNKIKWFGDGEENQKLEKKKKENF